MLEYGAMAVWLARGVEDHKCRGYVVRLSEIGRVEGCPASLPNQPLVNAKILAKRYDEHPFPILAQQTHTERVAVEEVVVPFAIEGVESPCKMWVLLLGVGERIEDCSNGVTVSHRLKSFGPY